MPKEIDKNKVSITAFYYWIGNPVLYILSIISFVCFIICIPFWVKRTDYWTLIFVLGTIYFVYRSISTIVLKTKIKTEQFVNLQLKNPRARVLYGKGESVIGMAIAGSVDGKYREYKYFYINRNKKWCMTQINKINELDEYQICVVKGYKIIADFYKDNNEIIKIKKLDQPVIYTHLFTAKSKKIRYPYVEYDLNFIVKYLEESDELEELYIVNNDKKYISIKMFPEVDDEKRVFEINKKEMTMEEIKVFLYQYSFVFDDKLKVFAIYDNNSPEFLKRLLNRQDDSQLT